MGKKVYSSEFKRAAVEQVLVERHTMKSVSQRLGVNYHRNTAACSSGTASSRA